MILQYLKYSPSTLQQKEDCLEALHKKVFFFFLGIHPVPPWISRYVASTTFFDYLNKSHPFVCCTLGAFINSLWLLYWKAQQAVNPNPVSLAWYDVLSAVSHCSCSWSVLIYSAPPCRALPHLWASSNSNTLWPEGTPYLHAIKEGAGLIQVAWKFVGFFPLSVPFLGTTYLICFLCCYLTSSMLSKHCLSWHFFSWKVMVNSEPTLLLMKRGQSFQCVQLSLTFTGLPLICTLLMHIALLVETSISATFTARIWAVRTKTEQRNYRKKLRLSELLFFQVHRDKSSTQRGSSIPLWDRNQLVR